MTSRDTTDQDKLALRSRALAMLARREHTRAELQRKLAAFSEDEALIATVLHELVTRKLVCDERYAEVRTDTLARKFGAARIEHELRAKGVAKTLVSRTVACVRQTEVERARAVWQKRFGAAPHDGLEKARQMRFLRNRGFSFDAIRAVIGGGRDGDEES